MWRTDPKVNPSGFVPLGALSFECGHHLGLLQTNRLWQMWWHVTSMTTHSSLEDRERFSLLTWYSKQAYWGNPHGKEVQRASRSHRQPLGHSRGLQPTSSRKLDPLVIKLQGNKFCQWSEWAWKQILPPLSFQMRTCLNLSYILVRT